MLAGESEQVGGDLADLHLVRHFGDAVAAVMPVQVFERFASGVADTAMHLWGAYVAAHHPGTNLEAQVKSAFEKYQASVAVLCDAGAIYSAAGTNTTASAAFSQATANAGQTLLDLENLLTAAGVKLQ